MVRFGWPDDVVADVRDDELGCAAQPGLERQLADYRTGAEAAAAASCRELQHLVSAVRAERRSGGQGTRGKVPVNDSAQTAAAGAAGAPAEAAVAKRRYGSRIIDLDEADEVLALCRSVLRCQQLRRRVRVLAPQMLVRQFDGVGEPGAGTAMVARACPVGLYQPASTARFCQAGGS